MCPCSLFDDGTVPTLLEDADRVPVTLGVRFTPQQGGVITGVKFYKGLNNTGTHTGAVWSADSTQLASAVFTDESTTGWQTLTFATPVTVRAGREYIASYRTEVGRYSATPNAFEAANLVAIPIQPAPVDLWATEPTLTMVQKAGARCLLIMNRVIRGSLLSGEIAEAVAKFGQTVAATQLGSRVAFAASMGEGRTVMETAPSSQAAGEVYDLAIEVLGGSVSADLFTHGVTLPSNPNQPGFHDRVAKALAAVLP